MASSSIPAELEAKLLAPGEGTLRAVARLAQIGPYRLAVRDTVRLHSRYLDTAELALARQGIALRLRRCGRRWEATAKWESRTDGDLHERPELTVALRGRPRMPFELKHPELTESLAARLAGRPLQTVLVTDIRRTRIDVYRGDSAPGADPLAEIALDRVYLHGTEPGGPETRYCEVEVERTGGDRDDIVRIATMLRHEFSLYPSVESKFERGITLLHHSSGLAVREPGLVAEDTVLSAARKVVGRLLEQLRVHDPGTRRGEDPEALHDMRVAARRLRAALNMFRGAFPPRLRKTLSEELKWLRECLGAVRDADVQLQRVAEFCTSTPAGMRPALQSYARYLERLRRDHRKQMIEALGSPRYFELLIRLETFSTGSSPVSDAAALQPVGELAADAVEKAHRGIRKRGRKVEAEPRPEDLHALRTRAKRLRYVLEFCRDLTGREGRRAVKRLVRLQDLLGAFHDAVVAADFVRQYVEGPGRRAGSAALLVMGALLAQELHRADERRRDFGRTWKRFERRAARREFENISRALRRDDSLGEPARGRGTAPEAAPFEAPVPNLVPENLAPPVEAEAEAEKPTLEEQPRRPARRSVPRGDGVDARASGEEDR